MKDDRPWLGGLIFLSLASLKVTAIGFAVPFWGERLTGQQAAGAVMVFAGIFLARSH